MNKMLIALAAAAFALALTPAAQAGFTVPSLSGKSLVQKAGCDGEDYAEAVEERAEARAEALEDGEGYAPRQTSMRQQSRAEPEPQPTSTPKSTADTGDKKDDDSKVAKTETETETQTADASEPKKSPSKSVASTDGGSCKKFFPSVGMTLSVPCE